MITEDFVSFETAKLLKEKNCPDFGYSCICDSEGNKAQTQSIIMKWLREVHNLHIIVFRYDNSAFPYIWYIFAHNGDKPHKANSYEEAIETAIKYCLENLI